MVARKTVCLRRLGGGRAGELQAGRFFASRKVATEKIVKGWSTLTGAACAGRHVLLTEGRSEVRFPTTAQRRRGLGPVKKGNAYGVLVHAMVAVDADSGSCLGLAGGDVWSRDGVNPAAHGRRPLAERGSAHWVDAAQQAKQVAQSAALMTVVADRGAGIYPPWGTVPDPKCHVLTRAMSDRSLVGGGMLFAVAAPFPVAGRRETALPARDPGQRKRSVRLGLRYGEGEICRPSPRGGRDRSLPPSVRLRLIEGQGADPPKDAAPRHWRLLATHTIADATAAWEVVGWCQLRWVTEQLFRVMESQGLQLEGSQMASAERRVKLAAAATKAACTDIQLTQGRDGIDQMPASNVSTGPGIDTLAALRPTLEGKAAPQQDSCQPPSLAWAAWIIARLGGWDCYYKPPGPITFRRGMERFYAIHRGRQLEMRPQREARIPWREGGGQRAALAQPDAAGADPLGRSGGVGIAVPDRAGALGTLCAQARQAAQETDGLGQTDGAAGTPLAARPHLGAGRRQRLCRPGTAGRTRPPRRDLHHPPAPRCRSL